MTHKSNQVPVSLPATWRDARFYDLQTYVGESVLLYRWYRRVRPQDARVTSETDICIESPPGSGNSFFVSGFRMANPDVQLAHHHHVSAQVKASSRFQIPTLVLLRDPIEAVLTRVSREGSPMIGPLLRRWIKFFGAVGELKDSLVIGAFETVKSAPAKIVEGVNSQFGVDFSSAFPVAGEVFDALGANLKREAVNPVAPDARREKLKPYFRAQVESHRLAAKAVRLYHELQPLAV